MAIANKNLQLNAKEADEKAGAVAAVSTRTNWISVLMTVTIILISIIVGSQLNRFVTPRIGQLMAMAQRLAGKDLTAQVDVTASDEIGRMGKLLTAASPICGM